MAKLDQPARSGGHGQMSRRQLLAATAAAGGAATLGLAPFTARARRFQDGPTRGGQLRVGFYSDAATMDPHFSGHKVDRQVYFNLYEPLIGLGPGLELEPGLAESWEIPDPTTYVLHLRQGVTFHDGTEFDADAVRINFERMMDPDQQSLRRGEVAGIDSVEAIDSHTLQLNLSAPNSALLATLTDRTGMIISPAAIEEFGADLARNPVGTGPFRFVEWQQDDHLVLERFDGYWDPELPYLDEINYRVILDDTVRVAALRNREIDIIDYVPPLFVGETREDANLTTVDVPSLGVWWLWLNAAQPPFDNQALRQAFASAFDLQPIIERIFLGVGRSANGPIPPSSWAYAETVPVRERDLDFAREMLAEGGVAEGFACTFKAVPNPTDLQLVQFVQSQVAEVGIEMDIVQVDTATQISDTGAGNFEIAFAQWSGRPDPDGNTYQHFHSNGGMNYGSYSNPQVDELLDEARIASDFDERRDLYTQVTEILQAEVPAVFVWHPDEPKAMVNELHEVPPIPDGMMRFRAAWLD